MVYEFLGKRHISTITFQESFIVIKILTDFIKFSLSCISMTFNMVLYLLTIY